jgi:hypothetical protein
LKMWWSVIMIQRDKGINNLEEKILKNNFYR